MYKNLIQAIKDKIATRKAIVGEESWTVLFFIGH